MADLCHDSSPVGAPLHVQRKVPFCLKGELGRVVGTAPRRTIDHERSRLSVGHYRVPASRRYELRDVLFIDGNLYKGLGKHLIAGETKTWLAAVSETAPSGSIFANRQSDLYFGHWLSEELPTLFGASDPGVVLGAPSGHSRYTHKVDYRRLYGLQEPTPLPTRCLIPRLYLHTSTGFGNLHVQRIREMKQSLRDRGWRRKNERVFVRRGGGVARNLTNEAEVVERLATLGFAIVDPETMSGETLARECFDAAVVVGVEGSHLAHAFIQLSPGASMVIIQPPTRFDNPFKDLCDASDIHYGFVVATPGAGGFSQPVDRLLATLALIPE